VDGHHPDTVAVFFEDGRFRGLRGVRLRPQLVDESAERDPAVELVLARELGDVQDVCKRLLATAPQRKTHVRACGAEQLVQRLGHRHVVPSSVQPFQQRE
jgi:hypothetical protein